MTSAASLFPAYLRLVDEEDDVGDGVDGHVDAQLNRPAVTDPRPDTHPCTAEGSEVAQTLAADGKQTQKKTRACLHSKRRRLNLKTAIRRRVAQKPGELNSKISYF